MLFQLQLLTHQHKYAFCPKGTSVIMYRSKELRRFQFFCKSDWSGGVYASPSIAGSRPGAVLAGAWAVVNHIGIDGYTESAKQIIGAARHFKGELKKRFAADLQIVGDPQLSVIAFSSKTLNIYAVGDRMSKKGWHLNALNQPAGLHMAFTVSARAAEIDGTADVTSALRLRASTASSKTWPRPSRRRRRRPRLRPATLWHSTVGNLPLPGFDNGH